MPIGSPGCVTRPRRSPPEARWISGAQGGGLTQRRAAVIRQVFDEVLLIRALLNERRRSESNRRIEVLQTSALPLGYGAGRNVKSQLTTSSASSARCADRERTK